MKVWLTQAFLMTFKMLAINMQMKYSFDASNRFYSGSKNDINIHNLVDYQSQNQVVLIFQEYRIFEKNY